MSLTNLAHSELERGFQVGGDGVDPDIVLPVGLDISDPWSRMHPFTASQQRVRCCYEEDARLFPLPLMQGPLPRSHSRRGGVSSSPRPKHGPLVHDLPRTRVPASGLTVTLKRRFHLPAWLSSKTTLSLALEMEES